MGLKDLLMQGEQSQCVLAAILEVGVKVSEVCVQLLQTRCCPSGQRGWH